MKNGSYESRKEQIHKEFARDLRRVLKEEGVGYLNRAQNQAINDALMYAAMVGASEARSHALTAIRVNPRTAETLITRTPILTLLGYKK